MNPVAPRTDAWRPADTAPRDGREILMAFGTGFDAPSPLVLAWCSRRRGWFLVGAEIEVLTTPTHWQPLPPPPGAPGDAHAG